LLWVAVPLVLADGLLFRCIHFPTNLFFERAGAFEPWSVDQCTASLSSRIPVGKLRRRAYQLDPYRILFGNPFPKGFFQEPRAFEDREVSPPPQKSPAD
jgi:hypothetical protein